MIHSLGKGEWDMGKFHQTIQNMLQFKIHRLFISQNFNIIFSN